MAKFTKADLLAALGEVLTQADAPAATAAVPARGRVKAPVKAPAKDLPARTWKRTGTSVSKSGRPLIVFQTSMRNGGTFDSSIPADPVDAIKAGV